jgi:hypothetical protein
VEDRIDADLAIAGSVSANGNRLTRGPMVLGGNTVDGNMTVINNRLVHPQLGIIVGFNTVAGTVACLNNDRFQSGFNTARTFVGQCSS